MRKILSKFVNDIGPNKKLDEVRCQPPLLETDTRQPSVYSIPINHKYSYDRGNEKIGLLVQHVKHEI